MKRTIIIDTDEKRVELLKDGYNIIEATIYDEEVVRQLIEILNKIVKGESKC